MTGTPGRVRVLLFLRTDEPQSVEQVYHQVSAELSGTPGLVGSELLRDVDDPGSLVVLSEWRSHEAFGIWESGSSHRATTAPLRPYQDSRGGRPFGIYEVTAACHPPPEG